MKILICHVIMLFILVSCFVNSPKPLKIAMNTWPGYELLYLAQEKGFFEKEGVNVQIKEFATLSDARRVFERGQSDILTGTLCELLLVREHTKQNTKVFFVTDYSNGGDIIIAHKSIKRFQQLKGKKFGLELGSLGPYLLYRALNLQKIAFHDVDVLHINQMDVKKYLESGKIDAVVTYPPFSTELLKDKNYHVIFSSREIPGEIVDTLMANIQTMERRSKDFEALLRAYRRAMEYVKKNPVEAFGIMAEREKTSVADFRNSFENNIRMMQNEEQENILRSDGSLDGIISNVALVMRETGQLKNEETNAKEMIWDKFFKK